MSSITITAQYSTYIDEANNDIKFYDSAEVTAGDIGGNHQDILLYFPLSYSYRNFTRAQLQVYITNASDEAHAIYRVLKNCGDYTLTDYDAAIEGTENWQTAGAAGATDYDQSYNFGYIPAVTPIGFYTLEISNIQYLKDMIDGTIPNYGFIIKYDEGSNVDIKIASAVNATVSRRPQLTLYFEDAIEDLISAPTLIYPNGGEEIYDTTINIQWHEPFSLSLSDDIIWYQLYITESYDINKYPELKQIATLPKGTTSFLYTINNNLKGKKCKIGIRSFNHKGQRSKISFSAKEFSIINRRLPLPSIFSPSSGSTYFSYVPFIFDKEGIIGRCSQRAFYQVYYSSEKLGIDWTLILKNIMIGEEQINWETSGLLTSSDYSFKIELIDGDDISESVFINNIIINNASYFIIDTIPPTGEIQIQNNTEYTNKRDLVLSLNSSDFSTDIKEFRIEQINFSGGEEESVILGKFSDITKMLSWYVDGDDGQKIIRVRFKDYGDNIITDGVEKYFRTYKAVSNSNVAAILIVDDDIWSAFGNENDSIITSSLYRNQTFITNLDGYPTSLIYYNNALYIAVEDNENKGILQRYVGSVIESVADNDEEYLNDGSFNILYTSDSVINSMEIFDNKLFMGLENGEVLSFNGSTISLQNNNYLGIRSVKKIKTDGNVLYILFENTTEVMIMNKESTDSYSFSIVDSGD